MPLRGNNVLSNSFIRLKKLANKTSFRAGIANENSTCINQTYDYVNLCGNNDI